MNAQLRNTVGYADFITDLLCYGADYACARADKAGIPGRTMAAWLNRHASRRHRRG